MRQHVNPLSQFFQLPRNLPVPEDLFQCSDLPIHVDIGCARGKFLLAMASKQENWNHLGVEIRRPLVEAAEKERLQLGLKNLRFLFCNANISLQKWLEALPGDCLRRVTIQFPDPWFKRRHQKRRVLQPELLISLASAMQSGGELFLQSDVLEVIQPMERLIGASNCFLYASGQKVDGLNDNPMLITTEREKLVIEQGLPVYRLLFYRNRLGVPDIASYQKSLEDIYL